MTGIIRKLGWVLALCAGAAFAQTSAIEGDVKGPEGPMKGAQIRIVRKDIKGNYAVKTDKKGHYLHVGLPLGTYRVSVEVDGKEVDSVDNVKTRLGDPVEVGFDMAARAQQQQAMQKAVETGTLTQEQERSMSPQEKQALEQRLKTQQAALQKNKALNDAFNKGKEAMNAKQYDQAVQAFEEGVKLDPTQNVWYSYLGEGYVALAKGKTGQEQTDLLTKAFDNYNKAITATPTDASLHNNYALALAQAKKFPEMQTELAKAVELDPPGAGRYYFNLGAVLTNAGQSDQACEAFKKAIGADAKYADAQYQYGICLMGKATTTADGKFVPPPGTKEAFEAYLALKPDGSNAEAAKGMLATMEGTVSNKYVNPDAPKNAPKRKK